MSATPQEAQQLLAQIRTDLICIMHDTFGIMLHDDGFAGPNLVSLGDGGAWALNVVYSRESDTNAFYLRNIVDGSVGTDIRMAAGFLRRTPHHEMPPMQWLNEVAFLMNEDKQLKHTQSKANTMTPAQRSFAFLLSTPQGRKQLATIMTQPIRCGGRDYPCP